MPGRCPFPDSQVTDRIKNDHRDAISLARLLRAGDLTAIWVPDETHEAMRDLIRARSASKKDTKIARQRIHSLLLRAGRVYGKKPWTVRHRLWLANQSFPNSSQQVAFQHYIHAHEQAENRTLQLEQEIRRLLPDWSLNDLVMQLQALKGVALIITSNQPFSHWDQIFPDTLMTVAAIDRIIHHATIVEIDGDSYRKKHQKKT